LEVYGWLLCIEGASSVSVMLSACAPSRAQDLDSCCLLPVPYSGLTVCCFLWYIADCVWRSIHRNSLTEERHALQVSFRFTNDLLILTWYFFAIKISWTTQGRIRGWRILVSGNNSLLNLNLLTNLMLNEKNNSSTYIFI
jgi:hypothetical protein